MEPKSVIIVGGSLAGLMHALTLLSQPSAPKVLILERSPTQILHNQGAGVVAGNETLTFLSEYMRAGDNERVAINSALRHYLSRKGEVISHSVEHRAQRMTSWDLLYYLLRWRVEGLETEYVASLHADERPLAEYRYGCTVKDVEAAGNGVKVTWDDQDCGEQSAVADLLIAADGASSTIRKILKPEVERTYAGYVAWRGTVPEDELSDAAKDAFIEKFTFFHAEGLQALGYLIPGTDGRLEKGQRLFNWVFYCNYPDGSAELDELMTDKHGKRHAITLPVDAMQPQVWEKQKASADVTLPPQFAEAVRKTRRPFVQKITDVLSPQNSFFDGRVLLVGDALAGFRPHTAASTGQAAFDAMELGKLLRGEIAKGEYDTSVMDFATRVQKSGVMLGERSQFGRHPLADK